MQNYRFINGEYFWYRGTKNTKAEAKKVAAKYQRQGRKIRITKVPKIKGGYDIWATGKFLSGSRR